MVSIWISSHAQKWGEVRSSRAWRLSWPHRQHDLFNTIYLLISGNQKRKLARHAELNLHEAEPHVFWSSLPRVRRSWHPKRASANSATAHPRNHSAESRRPVSTSSSRSVRDRGLFDVIVIERFAECPGFREFPIALLQTLVPEVVPKPGFPRLGLNVIGSGAAKFSISLHNICDFVRSRPSRNTAKATPSGWLDWPPDRGGGTSRGRRRLTTRAARLSTTPGDEVIRPPQKQVSTISSNRTIWASHPSKDAKSCFVSPAADHHSIVSFLVGTKPT